MTNDKKYTSDIIASSLIVYHIPLYQRLFEWGEKQISGLLNDLYNQFKINRNKDYYIGMLTATHDNDLVDGQQRFTVVMLIGIAFQQMRAGNSENLWGIFLTIGSDNQDLRLRFKARPYDEEYLMHLISNTLYSKENVKMLNGLGYIKDFLKKLSQEELSAFSKYVFQHLAFFISHLPKEYEGEDLNKYFETMNAGGKGLENYEILKVELFRNADEQEKKTGIWNKVSQMNKLLIDKKQDNNKENFKENLLADTLKQFAGKEISKDTSTEDKEQFQTILDIIIASKNQSLEPPKRSEKDSDDYTVVTFPEFLLLVLDLTLNQNSTADDFSYDTSKLLETFQAKLISKQDKELVTKFYDYLYWYRLLLDLFVIRVQKDNDGNNTYVLNYGEVESHKALRQYQSMLYVSTTFHHWLKPLLYELKQKMDVQQIPSSKEILDLLKKTDNSLRKADSLQAENMTYGNIDRYWFWRLDYYLWEENEKAETKDDAISKYIFRTNRSIEHLHPQNQENETAKWEDKDLNSFGNLAMISSGFNSTQSNDSVGVKFSRIKDQHDKKQLQSIKLWKMHELAQGNDSQWTKDLAEKHSKTMLVILHNSFPANNTDNLNAPAEKRLTE